MIRYIQDTGSYHRPGISGASEDNSKQDNDLSPHSSSSSRPLLIDKLNREGLQGNSIVTLRQGSNINNRERRQRHSAPDIFYGRSAEMEELRHRHEQTKPAVLNRRQSGKRGQLIGVFVLKTDQLASLHDYVLFETPYNTVHTCTVRDS